MKLPGLISTSRQGGSYSGPHPSTAGSWENGSLGTTDERFPFSTQLVQQYRAEYDDLLV